MLLLRGYEQWHYISFLGDHFSAVPRGRKLYVIFLVCLGSAFVVLCYRVLVCGIQLILLVLCRKLDFLSWGNWCPCWGHWLGWRYTTGRRFLTIVPWSWLFLGTLWPDIFPWKPLPNGVGAHLFVWKSQSNFAKGECAWPQGFVCYVRGDHCFLMLYPDCVHWCVTCCSWVWFQLDDDFCPDVHRAEGLSCPPLCHCGVFYSFFLCAECWGALIGQMEDPTVVWKFAAFSIPFLKDTCAFVLPFRSCWVLAGPHDEEKCACDQLYNGCVQICVCPLVDAKD